MLPTKARGSIAAVVFAVAALSILFAPSLAMAGTWHRVIEVPHRGTWLAHCRVYGQSWQQYYRGPAESRPLRMQITTRLYVLDKYSRVSRSSSVARTVYRSDYVSAQASYLHRAYISDAYSYASFVMQHADGSWSWDSYYGPHSGPLG